MLKLILGRALIGFSWASLIVGLITLVGFVCDPLLLAVPIAHVEDMKMGTRFVALLVVALVLGFVHFFFLKKLATVKPKKKDGSADRDIEQALKTFLAGLAVTTITIGLLTIPIHLFAPILLLFPVSAAADIEPSARVGIVLLAAILLGLNR